MCAVQVHNQQASRCEEKSSALASAAAAAPAHQRLVWLTETPLQMGGKWMGPSDVEQDEEGADVAC